MRSRSEYIGNIMDWGVLKVGDVVEYIRLYPASGLLEHGKTTITYKCNAYLELSNGDIIDGHVETGVAYCALIVGGKVIPSPPIASLVKKCLAKLQSRGHTIADPYRRVMTIIGESVGLALELDEGMYYYKKMNGYKHANRKGASTIHYKMDRRPLLTTEEMKHKVRFTTTWREQERESWQARLRKKGMVALDPPVHWHECNDIRDVLTGLGE